VTIYATLLAVSLSLGFWVGSRARNGTHLVNLSRGRTDLPAALLQSRTSKISYPETGNEIDGISSGLVLNGNSTSLRVSATDDCKMVGRNLSDGDRSLPVVHPEPFITSQVLVVRTDLGMTSGKIAAQ